MNIKLYFHDGTFNKQTQIGIPYASNNKLTLHTGDVVEMIDGKEGVVFEGLIYTNKEVGSIHHVKRIIKKYTELMSGEIYAKGLVLVC